MLKLSSKTPKTSIRFESNSTILVGSLKIQNFQLMFRVSILLVTLIDTLSGSDHPKYVEIHSFSSKDIRVLTCSKENLEIVGSSLPLQI